MNFYRESGSKQQLELAGYIFYGTAECLEAAGAILDDTHFSRR